MKDLEFRAYDKGKYINTGDIWTPSSYYKKYYPVIVSSQGVIWTYYIDNKEDNIRVILDGKETNFYKEWEEERLYIPEFIEQYTFINDKNNIKIYEGDILSGTYCLTDSNGYNSVLEFENLEVLWSNEQSSFIIPCTYDKQVKLPLENYLNFLHQIVECEIVGNTHIKIKQD